MADISDRDDPSPQAEEMPSVEEDKDEGSPSDDEILETGKKRFTLVGDAESEIRRLSLDDMNFIAGNQWPSTIQQDRERDGRPCLVINRLPGFVNQVTNDQRQNRPAIKVHPLGEGAKKETAEIIQGIIRHIEYNSNAEVAYDTAFESAVRGGLGYFRIVTDFSDEKSFDQEIFIKRIRNALSVYFDPYSSEPDGSDAEFAFVVDDLSKDEFIEKYPESKLASPGSDWESFGNHAPSWITKDSVRIAEYFYKEMKDETIHLLKTGEVVMDRDLETRQTIAAQHGVDASLVSSRKTQIPVIKWCIINGAEILKKTVWPGAYIPIIPVYGSEHFVDGKRILESLVRHAKDPQRMYNYWASAETEAIALAPRAPFIGAEGQFEGHEQEWYTANRRNHAFLQYKPTSVSGQLAPPPQRQAFEPAVQAITSARMMSADDLKSTTGVYDAGTGAQGPEISGVAIKRRTTQIQNSTFHFTDNLTRSMKHTGRILIDLIPVIYDTARATRIVGDDGEQSIVRVNELHQDDNGKQVLYDLSAGKYDATVDTGPSYASKREEAAVSMLEFTRAAPQLMGITADLLVKNMDWPGAQEMADRLKLALPPALQADPKKGPPPLPPQVQAQMQQMGQMVEKLSNECNELTKIIETKKLDLEHRERVELAKIQADLEINAAKLGSKEDIELLRHQISEINQRMQFLEPNAPIESPQDFNPQDADGGNYAGFGHVGSGPTGGPEGTPGKPVENEPQ